MIDSINKYSEDIYKVLLKETLDSDDISKLLMASKGLNDYIDFSRGFPDEIDKYTKGIRDGADELFIFARDFNKSLYMKYSSLDNVKSQDIEKDIIKLRKLTDYLEETKRLESIINIEKEIVGINNIVK